MESQRVGNNWAPEHACIDTVVKLHAHQPQVHPTWPRWRDGMAEWAETNLRQCYWLPSWPLCGVQGSRSFSPADLTEGMGKCPAQAYVDRRASPKDNFQDLREEGLPWWPSGWDHTLSMEAPGFHPSSGDGAIPSGALHATAENQPTCYNWKGHVRLLWDRRPRVLQLRPRQTNTH